MAVEDTQNPSGTVELELRDHFAAMALPSVSQALLAGRDAAKSDAAYCIARFSYDIADAMLAARAGAA